ncbi:MAG TPA: O-antigen ligase family protein [Candidatus Angelobacter sp.]|jgi:O-antigen ligase|nr:O-antigen ligase family protein [Candidatus Angelobacter sp.]
MSSTAYPVARIHSGNLLAWVIGGAFRPLHALIVEPSLLFLAALGLMLFHPPDFNFHSIDRFAFALLILVVLLRVCVLRQPLQFRAPVTWPMLALLLLAFYGVVSQPNDAESWSLFAAKWLVPFTLYQLAAYIFDDARSLRRFETFALIVLGYLSLTAIFFMLDARQFIFPRYILDEGLGYHADRARGPFLQAVANGVTLNLLGLIALNSFRRKRLRGVLALLFLVALPLAVVATKTRAVWLSFALSVLALLLFSPSRRLRRACLCFVLAGGMGLAAVVIFADRDTSLSERLEERGPVIFRMAIYQAGWEMFLKKPLAGWGATDMQAELSKRISDFHQEQFFFHNTYLEIVVQYGLVGLLLYLWIVVDLFKLGRRRKRPNSRTDNGFLDQQFRALWPLLLGVYLLNGSFVVMNYQFVNGLLFTMAGLLVAQNRRNVEVELDFFES